jgi:hypothetical protein
MNKFFKQVADKAKEKAAPYVAQLQEKAATVAADASALAAEVREEIAVTKAAVVESLATLRNENHPAGATPKENFARGQALFYEAIDRHENAKEAASRALADTANRKATVRDLAQELLAAASEKNQEKGTRIVQTARELGLLDEVLTAVASEIERKAKLVQEASAQQTPAQPANEDKSPTAAKKPATKKPATPRATTARKPAATKTAATKTVTAAQKAAAAKPDAAPKKPAAPRKAAPKKPAGPSQN